MKKLGLSVYDNDCKPTEKKFAAIIDESIMVNQEKLLLLLGIPADHQGCPIRHEDVMVIGMNLSSWVDWGSNVQELGYRTYKKPQKCELILEH